MNRGYILKAAGFYVCPPPVKEQIKKNKIPECWLILRFKQLEIDTIITCFFPIFCTPNLVPCGLIYTRAERSHLQQNSMGAMLAHVRHCVVLSILKKNNLQQVFRRQRCGRKPKEARSPAGFAAALESVSSTWPRSSSRCLPDHRYTTVAAEETFRERKGRLLKKAVMFFTAVQEVSQQHDGQRIICFCVS